MVAIASQIEAQRRSSEALGAASPRRAQMKRSHWVRSGIHRSLGALITRRVGHANARPQAIKRAPPTTTRANLPGFVHFSNWAAWVALGRRSGLQQPRQASQAPVARRLWHRDADRHGPSLRITVGLVVEP